MTSTFQIYRPLHPPTGVEHAVHAHFTSMSRWNVVLARTSLLEVFDVREGEGGQRVLDLIASFPLFGNIETMHVVRLGGLDALLLSFREAKLSLVAFDPGSHRLRTLFIHDFEPGFLEIEATAWSETYGYAGTLDFIAMVDGEAVITDIKTGKSGAWPDVALQLSAYANADYLIDASGERRPLPQIDAAAVLTVRPDEYRLIPVRLGDDVFDTFKALIEVSKWEHDVSKTVIGKTPVDPIQTETGAN